MFDQILLSFSLPIKRAGKDCSKTVYFFQLPLRLDIQRQKTDSLTFFDFYNTFLIKKTSYLQHPPNSRKLITGNAQNDHRMYINFFTLTTGGGQFALYRACLCAFVQKFCLFLCYQVPPREPLCFTIHSLYCHTPSRTFLAGMFGCTLDHTTHCFHIVFTLPGLQNSRL